MSARLCSECGKRPALFRQPKTGRLIADREHDLCRQCDRSHRDRQRPAWPRPDIVVTITAGGAHETVVLPASLHWSEQNTTVRDLLHRVRTHPAATDLPPGQPASAAGTEN